MSNPFDDLDAGDSGESSSDSEVEATDGTSSPESTPGLDSQPELEPTVETGVTPESSTRSEPTAEPEPESDTAGSTDPGDVGPGFEYSDVRQRPLYARGETWDELEDEIGITVIPELRRMGIRDEETREIHDALLKVALEHADEIPEQIRDTRLES